MDIQQRTYYIGYWKENGSQNLNTQILDDWKFVKGTNRYRRRRRVLFANVLYAWKSSKGLLHPQHVTWFQDFLPSLGDCGMTVMVEGEGEGGSCSPIILPPMPVSTSNVLLCKWKLAHYLFGELVDLFGLLMSSIWNSIAVCMKRLYACHT